MASNYGLPSINYCLLGRVVAHCFGLLAFPGNYSHLGTPLGKPPQTVQPTLWHHLPQVGKLCACFFEGPQTGMTPRDHLKSIFVG